MDRKDEVKVDTVTMFTSEIKVVEINTLSEELTLVIPAELEVQLITHHHDQTYITIIQKED